MHEKLTPIFNINDAMLIAISRHRLQKDKKGEPYTKHLFAVMSMLKGEFSKMAGVLHDSVEDTPTTIEELRAMGCPEKVLSAIELVTHKHSSPTYEEYMSDIQKIADSENQIAIDVKWADLTHNSDRSRIPNPTDYDLKRWDKYQKAKEILKSHVSGYLLAFTEPSL